MFIRTKRVKKKNGKVYEYRIKQRSVRIGKKVKSIYMGRADEVTGFIRSQVAPEPGAYLGLKMQVESEAREKEKATEVVATPVFSETEQQTTVTTEAASSEPTEGDIL